DVSCAHLHCASVGILRCDGAAVSVDAGDGVFCSSVARRADSTGDRHQSWNLARLVDTSLRCAGGNYAWLKAFVHPWPLGSSLRADRPLHLGNYFGPISYDHVPARFVFL